MFLAFAVNQECLILLITVLHTVPCVFCRSLFEYLVHLSLIPDRYFEYFAYPSLC